MPIHASPHRGKQRWMRVVWGAGVGELPALSYRGRNSNPHIVTVLSDENNIIKRRVKEAIEKAKVD